MNRGSKPSSSPDNRSRDPAAPPNGSAPPLIGGQFRPDFAITKQDAGQPHPCFGVLDRRGARPDLMAITVEPNAEPRTTIIGALAGQPLPGMLNPLAYGNYTAPGRPAGRFVICAAPPGPALLSSLIRGSRISDLEMIETVLRPAAHTLDALSQRGFTHRAIRPDNIFSPGKGQAAILGAAWAGPPGASQPSIYEPPYFSACHPYGRGEGIIADDIYALGVTLLVLALGEAPLKALDEETILRRKLHLGSYACLVEEARLPPALSDLLRGMLAEDPEHRPPPVLLTDPGAARARRVAARPPRRAQRAIEIGAIEAWSSRSLAHAMIRFPEPGIQAIKNGSVDRWLRRMLGDAALAHRFDQAVLAREYEAVDGPHGDMLRLVRATAALDPLAPFHWRGLTFWSDAMGALLAREFAQRDVVSRLEEVIETEAVVAWAEARPERCDPLLLRPEARHLRIWLNTPGLTGGLPRALYGLGTALPCQSALLDGAMVTRLSDLLPALERTAAKPERRQGLPVDKHIMSFISAHSQHRMDSELAAFTNGAAGELPLAVLRVLASIQLTSDTPRLPNLAAWLAGLCAGRVEAWHGRQNRERLAAGLKERAEAGSLSAMIDLLENRAGRAMDLAGADQAARSVRDINQQLARIEQGGEARMTRARDIANDAVGGLALAGLVAALAVLVWL